MTGTRTFGLLIFAAAVVSLVGCSANSSVQPSSPASAEAAIDQAIAPEIVGIERAEVRAAMLREPAAMQATLNAKTAFFLIEAGSSGETIYVNHPALRGGLVKVIPEPDTNMGNYPDGRRIALPEPAVDQPQSSVMPATSSCGPNVVLQKGAYRALVSCIGADVEGQYGGQVNVACGSNNITGKDGAYIYTALYKNITGFTFGRETGLALYGTTPAETWRPYIRVPSSIKSNAGYYYSVSTPKPPIYRYGTPPPNWEWHCSNQPETQLDLLTQNTETCSGGTHMGFPCPSGQGTPQITLNYVSCEWNFALGNCSGGESIQIVYIFTSPSNGTTADGYPYYYPYSNCPNCTNEYMTTIAYGGSITPSSLGSVNWGFTGVGPTDTLACLDNPPWLANEPSQTAQCTTGPPTGGNQVVQVPSFGVSYNINPSGLYYQTVSINAPQ
jgi:hypothetical protein